MQVGTGVVVETLLHQVGSIFGRTGAIYAGKGEQVQLEFVALVLQPEIILLRHIHIPLRMSQDRRVALQPQLVKQVQIVRRRREIGSLDQNLPVRIRQ